MMCQAPQRGGISGGGQEHFSFQKSQGLLAPAPACGDEFRDGEGLPLMVELRAGEFIMGENEGDKFANDTERPARVVKIVRPFALGKFSVTVGEFRRFCGGNGTHRTEETNDLPVVRVSWDEAVAYCGWLTQETGREYRLPSEAEWEFACRAGSRTPFACGDEVSTSDANFLYNENGMRVGAGHRMPVGSFPANVFGVHDMHGNVCEWVADAWHANYIGAPADGGAWITDADSCHVIRGGAWDYLPRLLRSSWRDWRLANQRGDNIGFRVATDDLKNSRTA